MKNIETHNQFYKIDDIPVKEFEIKFNAIMENGETIDLSQQLPDWVVETFWSDENDDALINGHSEFVSKCCQIFGKLHSGRLCRCCLCYFSRNGIGRE